MNERITELAEEAEQRADKIILSEKVLKSDEDWFSVFKQQFSELIVRECMDLALTEQNRYANITHRNMSECAVALSNFSLLMKDHFEDEQ